GVRQPVENGRSVFGPPSAIDAAVTALSPLASLIAGLRTQVPTAYVTDAKASGGPFGKPPEQDNSISTPSFFPFVLEGLYDKSQGTDAAVSREVDPPSP